jgi:hypothetical protein
MTERYRIWAAIICYVLLCGFTSSCQLILFQYCISFWCRRLGYLLFIDVTSWRPSWQQLLVERILAKLGPNSADYKTRIVFQTPESAHHAVHIMQLGHVMLDPFPVTGERLDCLSNVLGMSHCLAGSHIAFVWRLFVGLVVCFECTLCRSVPTPIGAPLQATTSPLWRPCPSGCPWSLCPRTRTSAAGTTSTTVASLCPG